MVTALDSYSARHDANLFGASGYITKPINDNELKSKIEKALKHEYLKRKFHFMNGTVFPLCQVLHFNFNQTPVKAWSSTDIVFLI